MKKSNVRILEDVVSSAAGTDSAGDTINDIGKKLMSHYSHDDYIVALANALIEKSAKVKDNFAFTYEALHVVVKDEGIEGSS